MPQYNRKKVKCFHPVINFWVISLYICRFSNSRDMDILEIEKMLKTEKRQAENTPRTDKLITEAALITVLI